MKYQTIPGQGVDAAIGSPCQPDNVSRDDVATGMRRLSDQSCGGASRHGIGARIGYKRDGLRRLRNFRKRKPAECVKAKHQAVCPFNAREIVAISL